jgi:hypothetical protein
LQLNSSSKHVLVDRIDERAVEVEEEGWFVIHVRASWLPNAVPYFPSYADSVI